MSVVRYNKKVGRPPTSSDKVQQMLDLHAEGFTNRAIAQRVGVNHGTVARHLRRHGLITVLKAPAEFTDRHCVECPSCHAVFSTSLSVGNP